MEMCTCYNLPPKGEFLIGKEYPWQYIIDGIVVKDTVQSYGNHLQRAHLRIVRIGVASQFLTYHPCP